MNHYRLLSSALITIAICAVLAPAQSGRRQVKPTPAAPVPTPTPEPTPTPKKENKDSELLFFLGADRNMAYTNASYPSYYYQAVLRGCADRLRSGSSAGVEVSERDLSRSDAMKKAKSDTATYVVYLSFSLDTMTARSYDDIDIDYTVFAPGTGKIVTYGRGYQNAGRAGPVIVSPPGGSTSPIYRERLLKQAGEDIGDRILKAMNLPVN